MRKTITLFVFMAFFLASASAQDFSGDRVTVPLSDPSRPGTLKVSLVNGGITVKAYAGKEIIVESRGRTPQRGPVPKEAAGLRRIDTLGLTIQEENNTVEVENSRPGNNLTLDIQVPAKTSLKLKTLNGGNIVIEDVEGEIEIEDFNGNTRVTNVAGSVVAHSQNGNIGATLREVAADKPMSLITVNGNIDLTLPMDIKASIKLQSTNGTVYTDFAIQTVPGSLLSGKRGISANINGGGPGIYLQTINGNIYVRKGK